MQITFEPNFAALTGEEAQHLATRLTKAYPEKITKTETNDGLALFVYANSLGLDHADIVMSLANDPTPMGVRVIERLIDPNKITRKSPKPDRPAGYTTRAARPKTNDPRVIATVTPNPKRAGSKSYDRYENYKVGQTVQEAIAAGVTRADINHDAQKGFITFATPA